MANTNPESTYALGYTAEEHRRLMRQSELVAPCTERLFRAAGIGPGSRVLDVGSGIGDVSLLLCSLVGPAGEVVGVERDASSIARAKARTEAAGFDNVSFLESDVTDVRAAGSFDAVVGRFILMYLPDPARTLRSLARLLRPHGAVAFLEPSWAAVRGLAAHLPLYTAFTAAIIDSFRACGVDPEIGTGLLRAFVNAGLPKPSMSIEIVLGSDAEFTQALCDILQSLEPRARQKGVSFEALGDLRTFGARLHAEIQSSGDPISWLGGNVGAWCRLPSDVATAIASQ